MKTLDIVWLAGLLEGEGCFYMNQLRKKRYARIHLDMVDRDIIARVADLFGSKVNGPYKTKGQDIWFSSISGKKSIGWMLTLYPLMGARRQTKILSILKEVGYLQNPA